MYHEQFMVNKSKMPIFPPPKNKWSPPKHFWGIIRIFTLSQGSLTNVWRLIHLLFRFSPKHMFVFKVLFVQQHVVVIFHIRIQLPRPHFLGPHINDSEHVCTWLLETLAHRAGIYSLWRWSLWHLMRLGKQSFSWARTNCRRFSACSLSADAITNSWVLVVWLNHGYNICITYDIWAPPFLLFILWNLCNLSKTYFDVFGFFSKLRHVTLV